MKWPISIQCIIDNQGTHSHNSCLAQFFSSDTVLPVEQYETKTVPNKNPDLNWYHRENSGKKKREGLSKPAAM